MTLEADRFYMDLALKLAARAMGRTSPNPMVGCVVVKGGRIVGRGFHEKAGLPHAEINALAEAGEEARGADLYVTLEPCSHHGRTPPCAEAVIKAGVKRVVAAMADPNPEVSGRGLKLISDAGIETVTGVKGEEAALLNEAFRLSIVEKRPFVHLKLAATLDGKTATATGHSRWVTGKESREEVHRLRDRAGAILVGVGTALADDPLLTVRLPGKPERAIKRFILDGRLRIGEWLKMLSPEMARETAIFTALGSDPLKAERLRALGAEVHEIPTGEGVVLPLGKVLEKIYALGHMELLVEGGEGTARTFVDAGLVDRFHFFYSTRILGGSDAVGMVGGISPERMDMALRLKDVQTGRFGTDIYVTGLPSKPADKGE